MPGDMPTMRGDCGDKLWRVAAWGHWTREDAGECGEEPPDDLQADLPICCELARAATAGECGEPPDDLPWQCAGGCGDARGQFGEIHSGC